MKTFLLLLLTPTLSKFSKAQSLAINTDGSTVHSKEQNKKPQTQHKTNGLAKEFNRSAFK